MSSSARGSISGITSHPEMGLPASAAMSRAPKTAKETWVSGGGVPFPPPLWGTGRVLWGGVAKKVPPPSAIVPKIVEGVRGWHGVISRNFSKDCGGLE